MSIDLTKQPTYALKNMIKALSIHIWLNSEEEKLRLIEAKKELKRRNYNAS